MSHLAMKCKNAVGWQWLFPKSAENLGEFLSTGLGVKLIIASNASVYTNAKNKHFHRPGNACFLLVEALPQSPENTGLCSGNAAEKQRLRDFAIAETEHQELLAKS